MSYDIKLKDPVTKEVIKLPTPHVMTGGTYAAEYDRVSGAWRPRPIQDAWLNVTYNYANYYFEAAEGDERFARKWGKGEANAGIRGIYGFTGAESIPMLQDLICRIECKYKRDGDWITTERERHRYFDQDGAEIEPAEAFRTKAKCREVIDTEFVYEGPNDDYWTATAANAISPLYKLIAMAQLRPDGVWDGD